MTGVGLVGASNTGDVANSKFYVMLRWMQFLYRGRALRDWHAHSTVPTNPDTRTLVKPTEVFRLS